MSPWPETRAAWARLKASIAEARRQRRLMKADTYLGKAARLYLDSSFPQTGVRVFLALKGVTEEERAQRAQQGGGKPS